MNQDFLDVLKTAKSFVLTGHERPDGDCVGAQVAMAHLLRALGKEVTICNPDPVPASFVEILPDTPIHSIERGFALPSFEVLMLLDCAHLSRLGRLQPVVQGREAKIAVVDHHVGSECGDGDVHYVDVDAPATGALVLRLFRHFGIEVPAEAAAAVFLSLVSDTGWFRYSNTTAEVYEIASELVRAGVDSSRIYDAIHRRNDPSSVEFLASTLARCELDLDGRFGYVLLDKDVIDAATAIGFDLDGVMEPLRSVAGMEVVAMLKQGSPKSVKVSLRASRDVDVQKIAASLGGGGHKKAAGATVEGSLVAIRDRIRAEVDAALHQAHGTGGNGVRDGEAPRA